jgi:hypothetical protein
MRFHSQERILSILQGRSSRASKATLECWPELIQMGALRISELYCRTLPVFLIGVRSRLTASGDFARHQLASPTPMASQLDSILRLGFDIRRNISHFASHLKCTTLTLARTPSTPPAT